MRQLEQPGILDVKAEQHNIAIIDDIVFAFQPPLAGVLRSLFSLVFDKIIESDNFCANKAVLKVCMDNAGSPGCRIALVNCPGACFLRTGGEIVL